MFSLESRHGAVHALLSLDSVQEDEIPHWASFDFESSFSLLCFCSLGFLARPNALSETTAPVATRRDEDQAITIVSSVSQTSIAGDRHGTVGRGGHPHLRLNANRFAYLIRLS